MTSNSANFFQPLPLTPSPAYIAYPPRHDQRAFPIPTDSGAMPDVRRNYVQLVAYPPLQPAAHCRLQPPAASTSSCGTTAPPVAGNHFSCTPASGHSEVNISNGVSSIFQSQLQCTPWQQGQSSGLPIGGLPRYLVIQQQPVSPVHPTSSADLPGKGADASSPNGTAPRNQNDGPGTRPLCARCRAEISDDNGQVHRREGCAVFQKCMSARHKAVLEKKLPFRDVH